MLYEKKKVRKAERQRKEVARKRRKEVANSAFDLLTALKKIRDIEEGRKERGAGYDRVIHLIAKDAIDKTDDALILPPTYFVNRRSLEPPFVMLEISP